MKKRSLLRIAMIAFTFPPWVARNPKTGEYYGGFFVDFWKEFRNLADLAGGPQFDIEFIPEADPTYLSDFTGVTMAGLDQGKWDVGWDFNLTLGRGYLYTQSMYMHENVVLTRRTGAPITMLQVFAPFKTELWLMILGTVFFGAFVFALLRKIHCEDTSVIQDYPNLFYHTWAVLLGGDEYDLYHYPVFGRLYRLGLLFLVLVISATYTANLAAFLTKPNYRIHGPQNFAELKTATVCVNWPMMATAQRLAGLAGPQVIFPEHNPPLGMSDRYVWAYNTLQAGKCDAIVDSKAFLKPMSLRHCGDTHLNPDISFLKTPLYHIMRANDTERARQVSEITLKVLARDSYVIMLEKILRYGESCSEQDIARDAARLKSLEGQSSDEISAEEMGGNGEGNAEGDETESEEESESKVSSAESAADFEENKDKIGIFQLSIVFIVFGACSVLAVLFTMGQKWAQNRKAKREEQQKVLDLDPSANSQKPEKRVVYQQKYEVQNEKLDAKLDEVLEKLDQLSGK